MRRGSRVRGSTREHDPKRGPRTGVRSAWLVWPAFAFALGVTTAPALAQEAGETQVYDDVIVAGPRPANPPSADPAAVGPARVPAGGVPVILAPGEAEQLRRAQLVPVEPPPPPPPAPPPRPPVVVVELQPRVHFATGSSFDEALRAHRYIGNIAVPTTLIGVAFPVGVEWLWIGGRFGMRGRSWQHPDREGAVLTTGDLLLTVQARALIGSIFELGAGLYGGAGVADLRLNGVATGQVVGRFGLEGAVGFRISDEFGFGARVGWDYCQWEGMNDAGHGVEIGGPFLGLALEGREPVQRPEPAATADEPAPDPEPSDESAPAESTTPVATEAP